MHDQHLSAADLSAFLDGESGSPAAAEHVRSCAVCGRRLQEWREVDALVLAASEPRDRATALPRGVVLAAACLALAVTLVLGASLSPARAGATRDDVALIRLQRDCLDGLELQASGLLQCLDGLGGRDAESIVKQLDRLRSDLDALRREHESLESNVICRR